MLDYNFGEHFHADGVSFIGCLKDAAVAAERHLSPVKASTLNLTAQIHRREMYSVLLHQSNAMIANSISNQVKGEDLLISLNAVGLGYFLVKVFIATYTECCVAVYS